MDRFFGDFEHLVLVGVGVVFRKFVFDCRAASEGGGPDVQVLSRKAIESHHLVQGIEAFARGKKLRLEVVRALVGEDEVGLGDLKAVLPLEGPHHRHEQSRIRTHGSEEDDVSCVWRAHGRSPALSGKLAVLGFMAPPPLA